MKGQVQGALVIAEPIKRLKLRIWQREREKAHRRLWRKYERRVLEVQEDIKKDTEATDIRNAAKQLLGGLPLTRYLSRREERRRIYRAAGAPPSKSPWLPERELCHLIDEALAAHHFKAQDKGGKKSKAAISPAPPTPAQLAVRRNSQTGPDPSGMARRGSIDRTSASPPVPPKP